MLSGWHPSTVGSVVGTPQTGRLIRIREARSDKLFRSQALKEQRQKERRSRQQARKPSMAIPHYCTSPYHDLSNDASNLDTYFTQLSLEQVCTRLKMPKPFVFLLRPCIRADDSIQYNIYRRLQSLLQEIQNMHVSPPLMGWLYSRRTEQFGEKIS